MTIHGINNLAKKLVPTQALLMVLSHEPLRKPDFYICENKAADQLCGNRTTDQGLCFCYMESTISLLPKSEISSF